VISQYSNSEVISTKSKPLSAMAKGIWLDELKTDSISFSDNRIQVAESTA
jgi:hypothetical protein